MLEFDGKDDYIIEPDRDAVIAAGASFTVEAYIWPESSEGQQWILTYETPDRGANMLFGLDGGRIRLTCYDRRHVSNNLVGLTHLCPRVWYHVVGVHDVQRDVLRVFVNGRLDGEMTVGRVDAQRENGRFVLGGREATPGAVPSGLFHGIIREVRFSDKADTQDEIIQTLGRSRNEAHQNVVAYWPLTENTGRHHVSGIIGQNMGSLIFGDIQWRTVKDIVLPDVRN